MTRENIEAIYPLAPMQQAFLVHNFYAGKSELGFLQNAYILHNTLNLSAFERAWQEVVHRHPALRTSFYWEELDNPLQVVYKRVDLPLERQDWRHLSSLEQRQTLQSYLRADRARGFDLSKAPLMRLALMHLGGDSYYLVWSLHHVIVDGWSVALISREAFAFYKTFQQGQELTLERPQPYRDYIVWMRQQGFSKAEEFWRKTLQGFRTPTPLGAKQVSEAERPDFQGERIRLSTASTAALQNLARKHQLTLNTVTEATWGLLLSQYSGQDDVVFGVAVSGRPAALVGVESIVGLFVNNLPVRLKVRADAPLLEWVRNLQNQHIEAREYEYTPLEKIQEWSEVPGNSRLFESLLIYENHPVDSSFESWGEALPTDDFIGSITSNYSLTLVTVPGTELSFQILYDPRRFEAAAIRRMLEHLLTLLTSIAAHPEQPVSSFPVLRLGDDRAPKVADRQVLPAKQTPVAPQTPVERLVAEIWQEVLGIDKVGVHDNFFQLGGYSLLALKVITMLEKRLGVRINRGDLLFETLRQLASACEERLRLAGTQEPGASTKKLLNAVRRKVPFLS